VSVNTKLGFSLNTALNTKNIRLSLRITKHDAYSEFISLDIL